jgi:DNA polymerase V
LVIVERSREAQHGDIVVAAVNSEPMCKLHRKSRNIILLSENPAFPAHFIFPGSKA